jgi:hypothetical protein
MVTHPQDIQLGVIITIPPINFPWFIVRAVDPLLIASFTTAELLHEASCDESIER